MIATHLLYRAATGRAVVPGPLVCTLCGCSCATGVPVGEVLLDTFTNHSLCRAPSSRSVCPACVHYFQYRWEAGQKYLAEYRKHSHRVMASGWQSWSRADMRRDLEGWLTGGVPEMCVLVVALSKKKHCLPLAAVNPAGTRFLTVQVEEERVRVSPVDWLAVVRPFDGLLARGFGKGEVLTGQYLADSLRRAGVGWRDDDRLLAPWRPSGLLSLVSYVTLTSVSEGEGEGDGPTVD